MTSTEEKLENMNKILHRGKYHENYRSYFFGQLDENDPRFGYGYLNLEDLVAVRAIKNSQSNLKNVKMYPSPVRPTIHFSLNHLVYSHWYGSWENCNEAYVIPFKDLFENNKNNFIGGSTVDIYFAGPIILPKKYSVVKRKENEEYEKFEERVEQEIENMGYLVVIGGGWDWGGQNGSWELNELFKTLGPYERGAHSASVFGLTDQAVHYTLLDCIKNKKDFSKFSFSERKLLKNLFKNPDLTDIAYLDGEEKEVKMNGAVIRKLWKIKFKKTCYDEDKRLLKEGYKPRYKRLYNRIEPYLDDWIYNHPTIQNKLK